MRRVFAALCAAAVLWLTGAAVAVHAAQLLAERVHQVLERRALGADALNLIGNLISHEGSPPPATPELVRELLQTPLAAVDVARLFERAVPDSLLKLVQAAAASPATSADTYPPALADLLGPYIGELAEAQRLLRAAATGGIDTAAVIKALNRSSPPAEVMRGVMRAVDMAMLARANNLFIDATARFVAALRAAQGQVQFPAAAVRLETAVGLVIIGTHGDDVYPADAALIIDPGGNDRYARAPISGGAVSVIVDLGGNDRYRGSDVVVHGLSAIVDLDGNDRYTSDGPGQGAAVAGASLIVDVAGDDGYEAGEFAQGAAAFGLGAIIDFAGNDRYRIRAGGQGYGLAGGVGLLWDRAGDDRYTAGGWRDAFERGGGISAAQGAAFGFRTSSGGGIGILRDDAGDDHYSAEMFAQGMGYYYGIGILWDRAGNDRYQAVRYAQGSGVHQAVGVLRDESGNDSYGLSVGVGQGMGLDLAVGVLYDGAGDDRYRGDTLVQGAATANGLGILFDAGGADHWQVGHGFNWGDAQGEGGMPSLGVLLHDPARARYTRAGAAYTPAPDSAALGGPLARVHGRLPPPAPAPECPSTDATAPQPAVPLSEALSRVLPGLTGGKLDAVAYAQVLRQMQSQLRASVALLPRDDFNALWTFARVLQCAARGADEHAIEAMWTDMAQVLAAQPGQRIAAALLAVVRLRPPPSARLLPLLQQVEDHPACSVRAQVLRLRARDADGVDGVALEAVVQQAQAALDSPCWRLRMAARDVLRQWGRPVDEGRLPSFLRDADERPRP